MASKRNGYLSVTTAISPLQRLFPRYNGYLPVTTAIPQLQRPSPRLLPALAAFRAINGWQRYGPPSLALQKHTTTKIETNFCQSASDAPQKRARPIGQADNATVTQNAKNMPPPHTWYTTTNNTGNSDDPVGTRANIMHGRTDGQPRDRHSTHH